MDINNDVMRIADKIIHSKIAHNQMVLQQLIKNGKLDQAESCKRSIDKMKEAADLIVNHEGCWG